MSVIKQIMAESKRRVDVDEFLQKELAKAGYGGVEITKTPLGTRITIYAVRPGLVIGRGGEGIRVLSRVLEEKFKLFNPQIAVAEVQVPELNPQIMASKIASALERGVHFRRACYWALNSIMNAGALGAEIIVSGKLTTERARYEKFKAGYLPKVGDPVLKHVKKAVVYTQLKPGLFGVKVTIVPPTYKSPDQFEIKEAEPITETKPTEETSTQPTEESKPSEGEG
ncbi:30S ribosomal protein S3 [Candidatus Bathyarchaeota archaeon]|nr:MAG: 30S ribosomal protein S3 [Candidatus Bathyarchaeota archaeon]